jgi:putative transport protein
VHWLTQQLIGHPEIAIFAALALGSWIGRFNYRGLGLGAVTGTLLVGVVIGAVFQADGATIEISSVVKQVFFLLFLFALGYKLGPQFFNGLKGDGVPQAVFTAILVVVGFATVIVLSLVLHFNAGVAAGLAAGALTQSSIIGVAQDSIGGLSLDPATIKQWQDLVSVGYAVTYIFGTVGAAIYCANVAPRLLGIPDLPSAARNLESRLGFHEDLPDVGPAYSEIVYRSYRLRDRPDGGSTVESFEGDLASAGHGGRVFIARVRHGDRIVPGEPATPIAHDDVLVLAGHPTDLMSDLVRQLLEEVDDRELLDFPVEELDIVVTSPQVIGQPGSVLRDRPTARTLFAKRLRRAGVELPVTMATQLQAGDEVRLQGPLPVIEQEITNVGYPERNTPDTDMVTLGLAIVAGALIGLPTITVGNVPLSLTTSVGALLAGLVIGWRRAKSPTFGRIPAGAQWFFETVGLTAFIAVVGITSGPGFISGLASYGLALFAAGVVVTLAPLVLMTFAARYVFHFDPVLTLGILTGAQTTTAAVGSVKEAAKSSVPLLGFTIPYAVGNILLTIGGAVVVAALG